MLTLKIAFMLIAHSIWDKIGECDILPVGNVTRPYLLSQHIVDQTIQCFSCFYNKELTHSLCFYGFTCAIYIELHTNTFSSICYKGQLTAAGWCIESVLAGGAR